MCWPTTIQKPGRLWTGSSTCITVQPHWLSSRQPSQKISARQMSTGRFYNLKSETLAWPSRLVATAEEDRLTFAPAHYRGAAIFGVADLACDLGTQARDCPKKSD